MLAAMSAATVTSFDQLVVLIPYLLGYHPDRSLVVVGIRGASLGVLQRLEWPCPWAGFADSEPEQAAEMVLRDGCDATLVVGYDDRHRRRLAALDQLASVLTRSGLNVADRLVVSGSRWWSIDCRDPRCCPPGGRTLPAASAVPAVAEWVLRGVDPFPDRAALAASIEPQPGGTGFDFTGLRTVRPSIRGARQAWEAVLGIGQSSVATEAIPAAVAWRAVGAAVVPRLRDEILDLACPGMLGVTGDPWVTGGAGSVPARPAFALGSPDGPVATPYGVLGAGAAVEDILRRLTEFARRLPETHRADTLAVTAACAWWYGHGTLARISLDRALALDQRQRLAVLVRALLESGTRPRPACA